MRLDNAPLLATQRDLPLFVDRETERDLLLRNLEMGWNSLVLGPPGIGKTSMLNKLAQELEDGPENHVVVRPRGRPAEVSEFLTSLAAGLVDALDRRGLKPSFLQVARGALQKLREAGVPTFAGGDNATLTVIQALDLVRGLVSDLRESGARTVVIVDAIDESDFARAVFGRLRDELWSLGASWVVAGRESHRNLLLQPPANAFFESVLALEPLPRDAAAAFVEARLDDQLQLEPEEIKKIAELGRGHPLLMLAILRGVASGTGLVELARRSSAFDEALSKVSPSARRLAQSVVLRAEPGRTNDAELQTSLGWSASRLRQLFHELVEAGAFEVVDSPTVGPGRPSKAYRPRALAG